MVFLPPKQREFLVTEAGSKVGRMPAPGGVSLVTSHIYTRITGFLENDHNNYVDPNIYKNLIKKTLELFYPYTGRLIPLGNGHYEIGHFDKGALFEVVECTESFQEWKASNFSYSVVPYEDLSPIKSYVGRDTPLFGVRLCYFPDGSACATYNIHHKIADGTNFTQFYIALCKLGRGEDVDPNDVWCYTDQMRKPVKPLPGVDHSLLYPSYEPGTAPPIDIKIVPFKKVIFAFSKKGVAEMKRKAMESSTVPLSQFEVLCASVHKAIIKARQREPDYCSDLVYIVSQHHKHPDDNMMKYLGNYIVPIPIEYKTKDVDAKQVHEIAADIHRASRSIDIPYMESLEYYLNTSKHVDWIASPAHRLGRGAVGVSDWSRFIGDWDFGFGVHTALRSFVDNAPIPLITVMPYGPETIEVIIQLDLESLDNLVKDREIMQYVQNIY